MIVYGSGNADGNRHTHDNLPLLLAGGGGGTLSPGRYVKHGSKPTTNLFLSMADRLGIDGSSDSAIPPNVSPTSICHCLPGVESHHDPRSKDPLRFILLTGGRHSRR